MRYYNQLHFNSHKMTYKTLTFEEWLTEEHAKNYKGLDDNMPEELDIWLAGLDVEQLIRYGDKYGRYVEGE